MICILFEEEESRGPMRINNFRLFPKTDASEIKWYDDIIIDILTTFTETCHHILIKLTVSAVQKSNSLTSA